MPEPRDQLSAADSACSKQVESKDEESMAERSGPDEIFSRVEQSPPNNNRIDYCHHEGLFFAFRPFEQKIHTIIVQSAEMAWKTSNYRLGFRLRRQPPSGSLLSHHLPAFDSEHLLKFLLRPKIVGSFSFLRIAAMLVGF